MTRRSSRGKFPPLDDLLVELVAALSRHNLAVQQIELDKPLSGVSAGVVSRRLGWGRTRSTPGQPKATLLVHGGGAGYRCTCRRYDTPLDNLRGAASGLLGLLNASRDLGVPVVQVLAGLRDRPASPPPPPPKPQQARPDDWWVVLGVPRDAPAAVIRGAYLAAVKRTHPDTGGTAEAFVRVQQAYAAAQKAQG